MHIPAAPYWFGPGVKLIAPPKAVPSQTSKPRKCENALIRV